MSTLAHGLWMAWAMNCVLGLVCGAWLLVRYRDDDSYRGPMTGWGKVDPGPVWVFIFGFTLWPIVLYLWFFEDNDKERH